MQGAGGLNDGTLNLLSKRRELGELDDEAG